MASAHHPKRPSAYIPTYSSLSVTLDGLGAVEVNYVEAGDPKNPTLLLLHGFPSDANQFRNFIPMLSDDYHILAPDLPGFGLTVVQSDSFTYTFDNLAAVISAWLAALDATSYAMYIFDYGAPVGLRVALAARDRVKAIISQNGNAYDSGFGHPFWDPIEKLWATGDSQSAREFLRANVLTLATTKYQYEAGVPEQDLKLIDPKAYHHDYLVNEAGKKQQEIQLDLFYDYRTNPEILYPEVHEYFRTSQVPLLAVWGKGDPAFIPPGAEAFRQDLPDAEIHFVDAGHFALETKRWEIAELTLRFLKKIKF